MKKAAIAFNLGSGNETRKVGGAAHKSGCDSAVERLQGTFKLRKQCGDCMEIKHNKERRLGNYYGEQFGGGYGGNVWDKYGICPALMTMQGGGRQPSVIIWNEE